MTITVNRVHETNYNKKRIRRLMQILHLQSVCRKKKYNYIKSTPEVTAQNVLNREFYADAPNEKWLTDVTEFKYYVGAEIKKLYLSAILDLMTEELLHTKSEQATITNLFLKHLIMLWQTIQMLIRCSIVTEGFSIRASFFTKNSLKPVCVKACPEQEDASITVLWKDIGVFSNPKCIISKNLLHKKN